MTKTIISLLTAVSLVACGAADKEKLKQTTSDGSQEATILLKNEGARITCESCSVQEQMALEAFQKRGITDKNALAALMGNIRQESMFTANICEGGARIPYERCYSGGYGLIQWTTVGRYDGLGRYAKNNQCNASTTECQLGYLFTEYQWKKVEPFMKREGQSIEWYMKHAYTWLGWGIHGARTDYAYNYLGSFS